MRRVLLILIVSALVVAAAWWLTSLPGHVTAQIEQFTIDVATPVVALGLLVLVLLAWALLNLIGFLITLPRRLRRWRAAYAAAAAQAEHDPDESLRRARQAWKEDPTLAAAALVYADRLRASGREARAHSVLREAWEAAPQPDLATAALSGIADPMLR